MFGTVPYLRDTGDSEVVLDNGGRPRGSVLPDEGTTEDLELCLGTQDWAFGKRGGLELESKVLGTLSICFRTRAGRAHDLVL